MGKPSGPINAVFRFPAAQPGETRSCDDFKYGRINECTLDYTPIALPTWGHLPQLCSDISDSSTDWSFFKADRASAYKNLPTNPYHVHSCVATSQDPSGGERCGFPPPETLLFGAAAAVHRCNLFSRIVAILANRIFGLPIANYVGDFGLLAPASLGGTGLRTFSSFFQMIGYGSRIRRLKSAAKRYF